MLLFPSSEIGPFGRRQRHVRGHRIPVTIARSGTAEGTAVVIDHFAGDEVRIGDCPCCTIREKLLQAVHERASAGSISRIAIWTEADILPILRTFMAERALGNDFYVEDAPALEGDRFTLIERAPVRWDAFSRFIKTLTALRGADLLYASGLMNIEGCHGPVTVQFMGHVAARPIELQAWPDGERVSRLEFVTRNIEERTVRDLFDAMRTAA